MKALWLIFLLSLASVARAQTLQVASVRVRDDHFPKAVQFFCTRRYSPQHCVRDAITLHLILVRYPVTKLGRWNFVLASSYEWPDLVHSLRGITGSPAFSVLDNRTTVLEEALFAPSAYRRVELIRMFGTVGSTLLEQAVSHELGHALCGELNEDQTAKNGQDLYAGRIPACIKQ